MIDLEEPNNPCKHRTDWPWEKVLIANWNLWQALCICYQTSICNYMSQVVPSPAHTVIRKVVQRLYPCTKDLFLWHPPDTCTWYNDIQSVSFCKAPNNTTLKARGWNVGSDCKNIEGLCAAHMLEGYSGINLNSIKMVCTRSWRYEKAHSPYTRYIMNG